MSIPPLFQILKIFSAATSCVLLASPVFSQSTSNNTGSITELIVAPGETYQVQTSQSELNLQKLYLGDNAVISFASGVDHWFVEALDAQVGKNVSILGTGSNGGNGGDGTSGVSVAAADCGRGKSGDAGTSGTHGEAGIAIQMRLGLSKFGTLKIDTSGGDGGKGGDGASGQDAGQAANCDEADGGDGGLGGSGGNGGDGGSIRISLWNASPSTKIAHESLANIVVLAKAGDAGPAGEGGKPGKGSQGRYVNRRSLSGNRRWEGGGESGEPGAKGQLGSIGNPGRIEIEELFIGSATATQQAPIPQKPKQQPAPQQPAPEQQRPRDSAPLNNENSEIEAMKKQIEALQKRLDEMEKVN